MEKCAISGWFGFESAFQPVLIKVKDNLRIIIVYLEKWGGRDIWKEKGMLC